MQSHLLAAGWSVVGVDLKDGHDCRDLFRWSRRFSPDLVVHCAAVVGGRAMIDGEPLRLMTEDLSIDAEMFAWALEARPKRIIYFSSSAAYPVAAQRPGPIERLREDMIDPALIGAPDQTYGWVKLTGERLAEEANRAGIRTHVFRPFSGYGSDQDDTYPFPAIIRRALAHDPSEPFEVWGDIDSCRDWVHIDDIVGCVLTAIEADDIGPMNICTGIATSFAQLAEMALTACGRWDEDSEVIGNLDKPAGVFCRVGDPRRMQRIYTPKISLAEGVARAVADLRDRSTPM
jgi:nucleoside-diphosphate-sugar epimerase